MSFEKLFEFEDQLARYTGAPYVVVTDGCTHALELCLRYDAVTQCRMTAYTYISILMMLKQLNIEVDLIEELWEGEYQLYGTRIWDSARKLHPRMYRKGQMQCLSFGHGKSLQLGKGGAILTDDSDAYAWLSRARSDGRDLRITPWQQQQEFDIGYHYCPTLELCEQGLKKLQLVNTKSKYIQYPDLRKINVR
jgi:dTDP-4-amino-4,6-dideoxygalactose transaminase